MDIALVNSLEFEADCLFKGAGTYIVAISDILNNSILSTALNTILWEYLDLAEMFSEEAVNTLPEHRPQDLSLETSGTLSFGLLYNLLQMELEVL